MSEKLNFGEGTWAGTRGEYGFWCAGDPGWLPALDLMQRFVNLGTKNGLVYEAVLVTGIFPDGTLGFHPGTGLVGWPWQPERAPRTVEPGECVPVTEIARGYVNAREMTDCCGTLTGTKHREDCQFRRGVWVDTMPGAPACEHCGMVSTFTTAGQLHHPLPWCPAKLAEASHG